MPLDPKERRRQALAWRAAESERQEEVLRDRLRDHPPSIVRLHPRLAEIYAEKVQQLETSLNHPAVREEATYRAPRSDRPH